MVGVDDTDDDHVVEIIVGFVLVVEDAYRLVGGEHVFGVVVECHFWKLYRAKDDGGENEQNNEPGEAQAKIGKFQFHSKSPSEQWVQMQLRMESARGSVMEYHISLPRRSAPSSPTRRI